MAAERRPLIAGLKPAGEGVDPMLEKKFVFGQKDTPGQPAKPQSPSPRPEAREGKGQPSVSRLPLTTRVRADYAAALKRASLERQLSGTQPNTLQDILEEALEPWLRSHGYIQ
jgi:hypothetical protein